MTNKNTKHWGVLLVCCGLVASSVGICINAVGVFYAPVSESLGVLRGTFALNSTITALGVAITSLFIPVLMKKIKLRYLMMFGVLATGIATILMGTASSMFFFYILSAIRGIGSTLYAIVPITMIINKWFKKLHGFATSVVLSFSGIAGAVFSPIFASLIEKLGWRMSFVIMGIILIAVCLPLFFYSFTFDPKDEGLLPYGEIEKMVHQKHDEQVGTPFSFWQVCFIAIFLFSILLTAITGITQHFPSFANSINYSSQIGAMMLSASMLGNIFSKLIIGIISDRVGAIKATIVMILANMFALFLFLLQPTSFILLIASFLFGSVYGASAVGLSLITKYLFGTENYHHVYPIISFATNIGGAFALTFVGYIYDFTGTYNYAFIIGVIFQVINILLLWFANRKHNQLANH